jgi:hypothetical protein
VGNVGNATARGRSAAGSRRVMLVLAVALAVALGLQPAASAERATEARSIDSACRQTAQKVGQFDDVPAGSVHAGAIDCLWTYGIVQGRTMTTYAPNAAVTRQQMASFVAGTLEQILDRFHTLPPPSDPSFADADAISSPHRMNVGRLQEAGIVSGYADGTFRPAQVVDRAQVASFVARALEDVTGETLPRSARFGDIGPPHAANIEKLATIGVVQGRADGSYAPRSSTTRAQMATIVARSLAYLADEGLHVAPSIDLRVEGGALGLTDVDVAARAGFDRATFTLGAGEGTAGWRVRYVDQALRLGSGAPVDVAGDAVLQVLIEGVALPPALDEELWDGERVVFGGDAIVEVVDDGVFEGQHQLFIGTTGLHDFDVARLGGPERVYVDVSTG